jgi:hypothetical protein
MKTEIKIAGLMILMMLGGMAIGALFHRAVMREHIRDIVQARDAGLFRPGPERMLRSLSPEQKKAVREVFDKHGKRLSEIHSRFRQEIKAAFESLKKELEPILTPKQMREFEKALPGPPPFMRPGPGEFPPGGWIPNPRMGLEGMKSALNLTDDQAARIEALFDEFEEKVRARRPGNPGPEGPEAFREGRKKLDSEIEKILSEEQRKAFREYNETPRGRGGPPDPGLDAPMPWPADR